MLRAGSLPRGAIAIADVEVSSVNVSGMRQWTEGQIPHRVDVAVETHPQQLASRAFEGGVAYVCVPPLDQDRLPRHGAGGWIHGSGRCVTVNVKTGEPSAGRGRGTALRRGLGVDRVKNAVCGIVRIKRKSDQGARIAGGIVELRGELFKIDVRRERIFA